MEDHILKKIEKYKGYLVITPHFERVDRVDRVVENSWEWYEVEQSKVKQILHQLFHY